MHRTTRLGIIIMLLFLAVTPVAAISNGEIDTTHTNVGAMLVEFEPGTKYTICSGSLVAPTVFLTAAHCLAFLPSLDIAANRVYVTFDINAETRTTAVQASAYHYDPGFGRDMGDSHDIGVILLSEAVTMWNGASITPASLPTKGLLDRMSAQGGARGERFINVGYGVVPEHKGGPARFAYDGYRRVSMSPFKALTKTELHLLMNNDATGEGGSCYGDSGSPKFISGTNTIVAITSSGDAVCRANNLNYRLDTSSARTFLRHYVTLP